MSFCRFSSKYVIDDKTSVDNLFISDFLPDAPDICVKVYLMGLAKCYCANAKDNNIINFANILNVSTGDIESAFLYWQDKGLVQLISTQPLEVVYLPISTSNLGNIKKYSIGKYAVFKIQGFDSKQNDNSNRVPRVLCFNGKFAYYKRCSTKNCSVLFRDKERKCRIFIYYCRCQKLGL